LLSFQQFFKINCFALAQNRRDRGDMPNCPSSSFDHGHNLMNRASKVIIYNSYGVGYYLEICLTRYSVLL